MYRVRLKREEFEPQKIELLNQLGFDWHLSRKNLVSWKTMYNQLVKFKEEHGHTRVPVKWHKNPKLGKWVSRMRQEKELLVQDRVSLLEKIGFDWGSRTAAKDVYQVQH